MAAADPHDPVIDREKQVSRTIRKFSGMGRRRMALRKWWWSAVWIVIIQSTLVVKRLFDLILALSAFLITLPLTLLVLIVSDPNPSRILRIPKIGRYGVPFNLLRINTEQCFGNRFINVLRLNRLLTIWNIIRGDLSWVGPAPHSPDERRLIDPLSRQALNVRPGLICLWWIRKRANINYGLEAASDSEYVDTYSVPGDIGIMLRSIPAILYGSGIDNAPASLKLLGIPVDNYTMNESVDRVRELALSEGHHCIFFVNPHCVNMARRNPGYMSVLCNASLNLADGIGMKIACKLLGLELRQNVNGTDLFPRLCESIAGTGIRVFLLGARPGIAERVADWIHDHHPSVDVCGFQHGYFSPEEEPQIVQKIRDANAQLLLVAFGVPNQELWLSRWISETGVAAGLGVGGLFDFYSGRISRAPQWVREIGMEWLYRFAQEPGRMWKRYFVGNISFLTAVIKERFFPGETEDSNCIERRSR